MCICFQWLLKPSQAPATKAATHDVQIAILPLFWKNSALLLWFFLIIVLQSTWRGRMDKVRNYTSTYYICRVIFRGRVTLISLWSHTFCLVLPLLLAVLCLSESSPPMTLPCITYAGGKKKHTTTPQTIRAALSIFPFFNCSDSWLK